MEMCDSDSEPNFDLLCQEDASCFVCKEDPPVEFKVDYESEEEYFTTKFQQETRFQSDLSTKVFQIMPESCLRKVRLGAIQCIVKTSSLLGFHFRTVLLSVMYFDQFQSKQPIDIGKWWAVQLLSIACLSLAAKMEESIVPALSQFDVDEYKFGPQAIQKMELLVLRTLEWRMYSITPFIYLPCFMARFCIQCTPDIANKLMWAVVKEINLVDHRPSVIAAATVLAASNSQLSKDTLELKMALISSFGPLEKENVLSCYNLMQEMDNGKSKTPNSVLSLPSDSNSGDVLRGNSSKTPKRRLPFDDSDQNGPSQIMRLQ